MVPGMQHCRGGAGTDHFGASEDRSPTSDPRSDMLAALIAWVENGAAPGSMMARRLDGQGVTERTRPLCPYPMSIKYLGGSPDDAMSFTCINNQSAGSQDPEPT